MMIRFMIESVIFCAMIALAIPLGFKGFKGTTKQMLLMWTLSGAAFGLILGFGYIGVLHHIHLHDLN